MGPGLHIVRSFQSGSYDSTRTSSYSSYGSTTRQSSLTSQSATNTSYSSTVDYTATDESSCYDESTFQQSLLTGESTYTGDYTGDSSTLDPTGEFPVQQKAWMGVLRLLGQDDTEKNDDSQQEPEKKLTKDVPVDVKTYKMLQEQQNAVADEVTPVRRNTAQLINNKLTHQSSVASGSSSPLNGLVDLQRVRSARNKEIPPTGKAPGSVSSSSHRTPTSVNTPQTSSSDFETPVRSNVEATFARPPRRVDAPELRPEEVTPKAQRKVFSASKPPLSPGLSPRLSPRVAPKSLGLPPSIPSLPTTPKPIPSVPGKPPRSPSRGASTTASGNTPVTVAQIKSPSWSVEVTTNSASSSPAGSRTSKGLASSNQSMGAASSNASSITSTKSIKLSEPPKDTPRKQDSRRLSVKSEGSPYRFIAVVVPKNGADEVSEKTQASPQGVDGFPSPKDDMEDAIRKLAGYVYDVVTCTAPSTEKTLSHDKVNMSSLELEEEDISTIGDLTATTHEMKVNIMRSVRTLNKAEMAATTPRRGLIVQKPSTDQDTMIDTHVENYFEEYRGLPTPTAEAAEAAMAIQSAKRLVQSTSHLDHRVSSHRDLISLGGGSSTRDAANTKSFESSCDVGYIV